MEEIKKILVALSLTDMSKGKFFYTANLATCLDADIVAVNIINSRDVEAVSQIVSMGFEVDGEHYIQGVKNERGKILQEIVDESSFPADRVSVMFKVGNPIDEILKIIVREEIDMVVMGPKGRTDLEHIFIGSVAEKLFRRSPVTIVSYRDEKHSERMRKHIPS
ncbi:MAG: universal stress protein [Desulfobacterales bacterium]|nr:universal stress protein [Desulfobacterales bacterium]